MRYYGPDSGSPAGNGTFGGADGLICDWHCRDEDHMDLWFLSTSQVAVFSVYFLSGILDFYNYNAGCLFLFRAETMPAAAASHSLIKP